MITLSELQTIVADTFLDGDLSLAGILVFAVTLIIVFMLLGRRNLTLAFIAILPLTLIFTSLSIIPESLTILLIVVAVLGIARTAKDVF